MSMNRMPMHSRQASYASYLDSQLQGRKSPADMLADGNSPYSMYLKGDPHDEGYIRLHCRLPLSTAGQCRQDHPRRLHSCISGVDDSRLRPHSSPDSCGWAVAALPRMRPTKRFMVTQVLSFTTLKQRQH